MTRSRTRKANCATKPLMFVRLQQIVDRFPEVEQLADLPIGWIASRDTGEDTWVRELQPKEWATE